MGQFSCLHQNVCNTMNHHWNWVSCELGPCDWRKMMSIANGRETKREICSFVPNFNGDFNFFPSKKSVLKKIFFRQIIFRFKSMSLFKKWHRVYKQHFVSALFIRMLSAIGIDFEREKRPLFMREEQLLVRWLSVEQLKHH